MNYIMQTILLSCTYDVCTKIAVTVLVTPGNDEPVPKKTTFGNAFARVVVVCTSVSPSVSQSSLLLSDSSSSSAALANSLSLILPFSGKIYRVPEAVGSIETGSLMLISWFALSNVVNVCGDG